MQTNMLNTNPTSYLSFLCMTKEFRQFNKKKNLVLGRRKNSIEIRIENKPIPIFSA